MKICHDENNATTVAPAQPAPACSKPGAGAQRARQRENSVNKKIDDDPALARFLQFLAADMKAHPDRLRSLDPEFVERMKTLTEGVEFSLDAPHGPANE